LNRYLSIFALIFRIALGITFIYASFDKISHPAEFAKIIHNYRILPGYLINIFAIALPWIELISGLFLVVGFLRGGALSIIISLLIVFMIAIGINIIRGVNLSCGCFTVSEMAKSNSWSTFIRDTWLFAMALFIYFFDSSALALDRFIKEKTD